MYKSPTLLLVHNIAPHSYAAVNCSELVDQQSSISCINHLPSNTEIALRLYLSIEQRYVTHSSNGPKETVCREYRTTKNSDGISAKTVLTSDYKIGGATRKTVFDCTDTPKGGKPGQFSVECVVRGSTTKVQLETSIIATDNKNYALLQTCTKTGSSTELTFWYCKQTKIA
uniref:Pc03, similar to Td42,pallidipin-like n=1 Tax=Panstrongylus chinai TaxID=156444 RepID=A0A286T525_9HEMI|nr:Pc03, similar to Td42,pallidipin-like [Panstrongylus chinai]